VQAAVESQHCAAVVTAMTDPGFYGLGQGSVEVHETHISWVFVAADRVYKVKKPLSFAFVDYSTLARRRKMCHEEVRLNRRLTDDVYLGVRAIIQADDGLALVGEDHPAAIEYAVEMRRLPEELFCDHLLDTGRLDKEQIHRIATRIAEFHAQADPASPSLALADALKHTVDETFQTLFSFANDLLETRALLSAQTFTNAFLVAHRTELQKRSKLGLIRDGHGDLRLEHVVMEGVVQIFDCVEFNASLREIDTAQDLGYMVMDLTSRGYEALARELVAAYRRSGGDAASEALLSFYACQWAWVRTKVECLRSTQVDSQDDQQRAIDCARGFFATGQRFAWRARRPLVLVICGVAGSGKTHLASALSERVGTDVLSSDITRKALAGISPTERAPKSAYSDQTSAETYAELGRRAGTAVKEEGVAIVDATFRRQADRTAFADAFGTGVCEPTFVECRVPVEVLAERVRQREANSHRTSDATEEIARKQQGEFAPLDEVGPHKHIMLRTDRYTSELVAELEATLDARLPLGR
jgi:uncharacterized protein